MVLKLNNVVSGVSRMRAKQQLKNAIITIKQIRNNEWVFQGHHQYKFTDNFTCYRAVRGDHSLWCANGAFSCGIENKPWELGKFGMLVWWFAARKKTRKLELKMRRQPSNFTV